MANRVTLFLKEKLLLTWRGVIKENPTFVLVLGMCPTLGTTTSAENGFGMGVATMAVLIMSNMVISLIKNFIPDKVRIPAYITIIAGFVTVVQMLVKAFAPTINNSLGIYLPLIVVNCIILGRAEMFARKNTVADSALDGLGMGLGFLVALLVMATFREVLGAGTILSGMSDFGIEAIKIPLIYDLRIPMLAEAPGGFLVYGILIAIMNKLTEKKGGVKRKSFSCEGCPPNGTCNKTSCSNETQKEVEENE